MSLRRSFLSRRTTSRSNSVNDSRLISKSTEIDIAVGCENGGGHWANMLPELLGEIIKRVEANDDRWPLRRNVVACGCVCKRWREVSREVVKPPLYGGKITFPSCLKQPGPRDSPIQCIIKRNKKNSVFYLYLAASPSFTNKGKFLLAARRYRNGAHTEYIISLDPDDSAQGSNAYVGKLRCMPPPRPVNEPNEYEWSMFVFIQLALSEQTIEHEQINKWGFLVHVRTSDFLGTKFTIYDTQPPHNGAKPSSSRSGRRFTNKQISPQVPAGNFEIGEVSYKFNLLKSRGPRRMICSLKCTPSPHEPIKPEDERVLTKSKSVASSQSQTLLRNKAPRWHEHLQCWCLNFHGRVTVASVKNFQLVATLDQSQPGGEGDGETVLLQFGKVGDDVFTMDYRQPLSAFHAFAVCLTSFGTKLACE